MHERFQISVRRACALALLQRSTWYAKSVPETKARCASAFATSLSAVQGSATGEWW